MIGRATSMACVLALGGALLGGCGGGTQTVSVSSAPAPAAPAAGQTAAHTTSTASTPAHTTPTTPAPTGAATPSQQSAGTTRTAPAPAFLHTTGQSAEQAAGAATDAAAAVVSAHGYTPVALSVYHPNQTLRVLIGTLQGSTAGYDQLAFFFLDGRYLGTDSTEPSASVRVVAQSDTEVTLAYALYRPHDTTCCPSGGQAVVHFQLDNGTLTPLQPLPPASSASGLSRQ
jgi:hypothetical protein